MVRLPGAGPTKFKVGQRVRVPFGGDYEIGIVRRVSDTGRDEFVQVELHIEGTDEPYISSWLVDRVEPAPAA